MIVFTKHAKEKFAVLKIHKFVVTEAEVRLTLRFPELVDHARLPLLIAQRQIDNLHVLRVVYKKDGKNIKVITFYPGRVKQYEKENTKT